MSFSVQPTSDSPTLIRDHTGDNDNLVAVHYQANKWITFSDKLFAEQAQAWNVQTAWDPPGEEQLTRGSSQHSYFDGQRLSTRSEVYRSFAVNWFIRAVVADYFQHQRFTVQPTRRVIEALGGDLPKTREDIATLAQNPELLGAIACLPPADIDPEEFSPVARQAIAALLDSTQQLRKFMDNPETYLDAYGDSLPAAERKALVQAATDKPDLVQNVFDHIELGEAQGDQNFYILLSANWKDGHYQQGLEWVQRNLPKFIELNGFVPCFGYCVTEAQLRFCVALAPNVSDREKDFLQFHGHTIIDCRQPETADLLFSRALTDLLGESAT